MAGSCSGTRLFVAFCCLTLVAGFVGNVLSSAAWRLGLGQGRLGQKSLQRSAAIMKEAKTLLPGGVSSPVRAFAAVGGDPIVFDSVKGSRITDVDGNGYIDFVGSWGTAIVGHAHPEVLRAMTQTAAKGTSFGAPSALENELVKSVRRLMPSIDLLRFTSSGTEACMGALRVARAFTGRRKVIKFDGCYHGHADSFLVKAGSGVATLGHPDSPGVPAAATADTLVAEFNNIQSVRALLESPAHRGQVAAVIVEPIVGNAGFITPRAGFLTQLRELCTKHGALLVFDEVMTGFRVAPGGAQALYGVRPDLTTMGKIIGGGLPVGAFGGRRDVMSMLAPAGPVYQAGTLSGNPLAMASGIKTLEILQREAAKGTGAPVGAAVGAVAGYRNENAAYDRMHALSGRFVEGLKAAFRQHYRGSRPVSLQGSHINGMFGYFFNAAPVGNYADAKRSDASLFRRFHSEMLKRGVYLPPSPYEACFMTLAHTEADIDRALEAAAEVFKTL